MEHFKLSIHQATLKKKDWESLYALISSTFTTVCHQLLLTDRHYLTIL